MKGLLKSFGIVVLLAILFGFGYGWRDLREGRPIKFRASGEEISTSELFERQFTLIKNNYSGTVDGKKLKYAAITGMMASLGDPHTMFMEPVMAKEFNSETEASFVGVGARLDDDPLGAKVVIVFEKSPAMTAGLRAGDTITAVDGKSVSGMEVEDIVTKIRGASGTVVHLTVIRPSVNKPVEVYPRRAAITTPTVEGTMIPNTKIGRLAVSMFSEPTAEQFSQELAKLENKGMTGLVIDMRGNGGGLLKTAIDMLSMFLDDKVVVRLKGREGREQVERTESGMLHKFGYPIVILLNEDSASATEIFSGCLRDYKKVTIVGEHSYGKASVQDVLRLTDGSNAKYTIARYYLPSTPDISRKVDEDGQYLEGGLMPDVKVALDPNVDVVFGDIKTDNQLAKAVEVVKSKM